MYGFEKRKRKREKKRVLLKNANEVMSAVLFTTHLGCSKQSHCGDGSNNASFLYLCGFLIIFYFSCNQKVLCHKAKGHTHASKVPVIRQRVTCWSVERKDSRPLPLAVQARE